MTLSDGIPFLKMMCSSGLCSRDCAEEEVACLNIIMHLIYIYMKNQSNISIYNKILNKIIQEN